MYPVTQLRSEFKWSFQPSHWSITFAIDYMFTDPGSSKVQGFIELLAPGPPFSKSLLGASAPPPPQPPCPPQPSLPRPPTSPPKHTPSSRIRMLCPGLNRTQQWYQKFYYVGCMCASDTGFVTCSFVTTGIAIAVYGRLLHLHLARGRVTHTYAHTYVRIYTHTDTYTRICTHMHARTHTHTHLTNLSR